MAAVLIIEDEVNIRLFISANLEARGYIVIEAGTGGGGIKAMREQLPKIVILDMLLPDMSGWDVLAAMAADQSLAEIPVILMTASVNSTDPQRHEYANLVDRLTKPASVDTLLAAVHRHIRD
jgi:CheY-like chemotaxis protein